MIQILITIKLLCYAYNKKFEFLYVQSILFFVKPNGDFLNVKLSTKGLSSEVQLSFDHPKKCISLKLKLL